VNPVVVGAGLGDGGAALAVGGVEVHQQQVGVGGHAALQRGDLDLLSRFVCPEHPAHVERHVAGLGQWVIAAAGIREPRLHGLGTGVDQRVRLVADELLAGGGVEYLHQLVRGATTGASSFTVTCATSPGWTGPKSSNVDPQNPAA
jgi:hypothetical protein